MGRSEWVLERLLVRATAAVAESAGGRWRRIGLEGAGGLDWRPGSHVRVRVGELTLRSPRDLLRTYTVWDYDGDALELRVLEHGEGPGTRWAREVEPGTPVMFKAPEGRFTPREGAPGHLFVGEETASVAFAAMARTLDGPCRAVVETGDPADRLPIEADVTWLDRGTASAADPARLVEAVAAQEGLAPGTVAYLAGEARTCQAVKRHLLRERGWPRRDIVVKPFWTPGRRGMD
ncbi:siderophore-interacting protein [Streptomyces roseirectus]|uniref:Siderophore-interacting protein n=1 Tax=Streptomyces roseirectus TaxID=2768066 RepID=A0A7H0I5H6_9ACTN|nr:siderophore-interacting protein [Streptomyces roseirectus]QNP68042.1 siderophore-interacting protein [Streptomyces roseirectus]